jgi:aminocarboxymuconate-semialdehyde decarboxylase
VIGNPFDTTLALHYLGGYLSGYCGRIDHAWGARSDAGNLPKPPTEYLKRVYVDSVVFTPHPLKYLIEVFGPITSSWAPTIHTTWRIPTRSAISA